MEKYKIGEETIGAAGYQGFSAIDIQAYVDFNYYGYSGKEDDGVIRSDYTQKNEGWYEKLPSGVIASLKKQYTRIELAGKTALATLNTISVSTHRDKFPVAALSRTDPKGFTSGHRTVAGTLSFSTILVEAFYKAIEDFFGSNSNYHVDDLPPFDVQIILSNDFGQMSQNIIKGITILDQGTVYSTDNIIPGETYSYMARSVTPLQFIGALNASEVVETSEKKGLSDQASNPNQGSSSTSIAPIVISPGTGPSSPNYQPGRVDGGGDYSTYLGGGSGALRLPDPMSYSKEFLVPKESTVDSSAAPGGPGSHFSEPVFPIFRSWADVRRRSR